LEFAEMADPADVFAEPPAVDWLVLMSAAHSPVHAYMRKRAVANHGVALDKLASMDVDNRRHLVTIRVPMTMAFVISPMATLASN
jgi:hypothetical protein